MNIGNLEEKIQRHNSRVRRNSRDRVCYRTVCAACGEKDLFRAHELRRRGLRYMVENMVICTTIYLARWRCCNCGRRFTDYPSFVLPYKRFAAPCLLSRATRYLDEANVTYRTSVQHGRQRIGYPVARDASANGDQVKEQSVVDHSLIWRMVGWLGSLTLSLNKAREMILQTVPDSLCHRYPGSVAPHKAHNPKREDRLATLETARQLLSVMLEWEECFDSKFFPRFATRSGFD